jgi:voltage-gated sodium channel
MLFIVLCSTLILILETYNELSDYQRITEYFAIVFSLIFWIELIIKVIDTGFLFGKDAYINDNWNKIDFLLCLISVTDFTDNSLPALKVLRLIRFLKALRLIAKVKGIKFLIECIIYSFDGIINVSILIFFLILLFGIFFMQTLSGISGYCDGKSPYYNIN